MPGDVGGDNPITGDNGCNGKVAGDVGVDTKDVLPLIRGTDVVLG